MKPKDVYIHNSAEVSSKASVGKGTKIWNGVQIREGAIIGENCNIGKDVYIDKNVIIGNCVKIQNGVSIYDGVEIEDYVFLGPHMTFTNDLYPRSFNTEWRKIPTKVRYGASIGANATVVCGVTIGKYAMVGAGAVVTQDVPDHALAVGNPAKVIGYVCKCGQPIHYGECCKKCGEVFTGGNE
ncbi:acyltransferase [Parageobacillus thermoglucosidasius]|uniref:Putative acetyltransferase n=1 Tax=Geobacillus sp. (strain Y4.1MC1) TaxID=581103 RepID=A0A7U4DJI9_GEOS0|nr:acyltransferase [Parageobacillus thermoglucosidasius]EID42445.1 acyltransferase [Parageobacillus thermoglucosidasius TNO-09.020]BDG30665.1 N-acetyltransferase [Parageobacillus thermoglucosidasius]